MCHIHTKILISVVISFTQELISNIQCTFQVIGNFQVIFYYAKSLQSCLTLCDPIDGSPPGSSVHRIL